MKSSRNSDDNRLDDAARAGWLYYIGQNTQDEIAEKMGISRQSAQRLVAMALRERLVKFRMDHPVARCLDLAQRIRDTYHIDFCEVTMTDPTSDDPALGIAEVAGSEMEKHLKSEKPIVMGLGTGKEIRGAVDHVAKMTRPQHRLIALVGNLAPDGSANINNPMIVLGDRTGAIRHPLAVPVVASTKEERAIICALGPIRKNTTRAQTADIAFVGIGEMNDAPPVLTDGFITPKELKTLHKSGVAGEILGWMYDHDGAMMACPHNDRVTSVPQDQPPKVPTIGVARGANKLTAIKCALKGRWVTGLITDETTAEALIS